MKITDCDKDEKAFKEKNIIVKYEDSTFGITIPETKTTNKKEKKKVDHAKNRQILEMNVGSAPQSRFYNLGVKVAF